MSDLLNLNQITKSFDGVAVLNNISLAIQPGMVVGLLGKNGAGKTTLMRIALGLQQPDSGLATCLGMASNALNIAVKERIGYVPQQAFGYDGFTVRDALRLHASFYPNWDHGLECSWLKRFQLADNQVVEKLSIGQRQALALIMAMAYRPKLLLLDEPVASLDPITRRAFMSDLFELALESGSGILFSSHITTDLERVASHVALIKDGELILNDEIDTVKEQTRLIRFTDSNIDLSTVKVLNRHAQSAVIFGYSGQVWPSVTAVQTLSLEQLFIEVHES
ncbi:ABC transporter ATP-binding protein [Pseudoalteromonas fenneropenaei]|uniref:ABC transporter ATP-binding protein n=1 Tax=Pseudoalteromonas fenneropenaei TaxID=1737459 RepID=A0ABV7CPW4_9GAMM